MILRTLLVLGLAFVGRVRGETFRLANEAATTRGALHWKRKTAMAIGRPDLETAPDDDLDAAHDKHMQVMNEMEDVPPGPESAANELQELRRESAEMQIELAIGEGRIANDSRAAWEQKFTDDYEAAKTALANEKKTEPTALANEELVAARKESADLQIANALEAGRILPAEKDAWVKKFADDYATAKAALANEKTSKIKVAPRTKDLGDLSTTAIANESDRRAKIQSLVNEAMPKFNNDYEAAFAFVQADPKNKPIFDAMKKPASKK